MKSLMCVSAAVLAVTCSSATAQLSSAPTDASAAAQGPTHPWLAPLPKTTADAYFSNLQDGAKIETPFRLTFGLAGGWGLAPIASPSTDKSGHHHLLVNKDLPLNFKQALPFNDQYIHFGKGQMETVLTLEPGTYTLRLLLADDKHVPRFVYSKPLTVTVTRKNASVDAKTLTRKGIAFLNLPADQKVRPPFRLQFHASGLNVAHRAQQAQDTGHFRLTVTPQAGGKPAEIDLINGQTEVWLSPPPGTYALKLDFLDNVTPGKVLAESVLSPVKVE